MPGLPCCDLFAANTDIRLTPVTSVKASSKTRTVDQVKAERERDPAPQSEKELRRAQREQIQAEKREAERQRNLKESDAKAAKQWINVMKIAMGA
jgi:hypothetical protein